MLIRNQCPSPSPTRTRPRHGVATGTERGIEGQARALKHSRLGGRGRAAPCVTNLPVRPSAELLSRAVDDAVAVVVAVAMAMLTPHEARTSVRLRPRLRFMQMPVPPRIRSERFCPARRPFRDPKMPTWFAIAAQSRLSVERTWGGLSKIPHRGYSTLSAPSGSSPSVCLVLLSNYSISLAGK